MHAVSSNKLKKNEFSKFNLSFSSNWYKNTNLSIEFLQYCTPKSRKINPRHITAILQVCEVNTPKYKYLQN